MHHSLRASVLMLLLCMATSSALLAQPMPASEALTRTEMTTAAQAFLETLDEEARAQAMIPLEDEERFNWHFTPRKRKGLPLKAMTTEQRIAAHDLMQSALSSKGYLKATSIMQLEAVLKMLEDGSPRRDQENYAFSVFGTPSLDAPWGWRLEGHHLSLNYTSTTDELAATPAFFGSNPAEVRAGPSAGLRVLAAEEDLARDLMAELDEEQRAKATILEEAPDEIITGVVRKVSLDTFEGLPAAEMTDVQRGMLRLILEEYAHNMPHDVAHRQLQKIDEAGFDSLHFGWAGTLERGGPHYYRVHGPTLLLEYDNTQNDANHIHTIWRDFEGDFGEDLLQRHYETSDAAHGHRSDAIVEGTVTYRERMALPPGALVDVWIIDASPGNVAAPVIAETTIEPKAGKCRFRSS